MVSFRSALLCVEVSALAMAAVAIPAPAAAQTAPEEASTSSDIIVTARKRNETLVDVPISITAVTGAELRAQGAANLDDYAGKVPGLAIFTRGPTSSRQNGATFGIRGVTGGLSDPPVGFYLNDTPLPAINLKLFDIDTIEVLKGPQGTLYGARALGGLIKVSTRRPDLERLSGSVEIQPSFTDGGGANVLADAAINIPLVPDKLALRVSAYSVHEKGYVDRLPGATAAGVALPAANPDPAGLIRNTDTELTQGARASLLFKADSSFKIQLDYIYQHARQSDRSEWDVPLSKALGRPYVNGSFIAQPSSTNFNDVSLTVDKSLGKIGGLTSTTSYVDYRSDDVEDGSYIAQSVLASLNIPDRISALINTPISRKLFTQELRLSSNTNSWIDYTAGAFFQHSKQLMTFNQRSAEFGELVNAKFGAPVVTDGLLIYSPATTRIQEIGLFGELYIRPIQSISITLGGRYFDNRFKFDSTRTGFFGAPPTMLRSHDHGFNPKAAISWKPTRDVNVYASATKGFRRGGANAVSVIPSTCGPDLASLGYSAPPPSYKSDSLWQYEIGAKAALRGGFSFEAAAFRTDWNDRQLTVLLPRCGFSIGANVGKARIDGAELALHFRPDHRLSFDGTASYLDSRLLEDTPQAGLKKGDRLPLAPSWTFSFGGQVDEPLTDELNGFARADYQYRSSVIDATNRIKLPAFGSLNLRAGVTYQDVKLAIFAENVTNSRGKLGAEGSGFLTAVPNAYRVHSLRPRTIGLSLAFDWK